MKQTKIKKYNTNVEDLEIKNALIKADFNYTEAAKSLNITRQTLKNRIAKSVELTEIAESGEKEIFDEAKTGLKNAIKKGESWAILRGLQYYADDEKSELVAININVLKM